MANVFIWKISNYISMYVHENVTSKTENFIVHAQCLGNITLLSALNKTILVLILIQAGQICNKITCLKDNLHSQLRNSDRP